MKHCVECNEALEDNAKFCSNCVAMQPGSQKEQQNACKNCGEELQEKWKACPHCGTQVESRKSSPPAGSSPYEMVSVPGGSFKMEEETKAKGFWSGYGMGEKSVHEVTLCAFHIGKYEVTQALYESVMGNNPSNFPGDNLPVEQVTWYDAVDFCNKLSEREGLTPYYTINKTAGSDPDNTNRVDKVKWLVMENTQADGYRLPTEAEWEYAARGGDGSPMNYPYAGSTIADSVAWYQDNSGETTHAVGTKAPNSLGVYDMSGNVSEWCWDWYEEYPSPDEIIMMTGGESALTDPAGPSSGEARVRRGGGWADKADGVRSSARDSRPPFFKSDNLGFRLARN